MDNVTLKKKMSSYVSDKGYLKNVPDDILYELLVSWENWTASSKEFYASLGFTHRQMASLIGKAKKLKREGYFGEGDFKQIQLPVEVAQESIASSASGVAELVLSNGRLIRFLTVEHLLDFLKKSA